MYLIAPYARYTRASGLFGMWKVLRKGLISYREGGRHGRSFGVPALQPPPPARSCRARYLLNCALRWWQRTQHHRFPFSVLCRFGQWPMRSTAMARHHEAVAQLRRAARPCAAASRCALWQRHITALPCSMLCSLSQWALRITAMPSYHEAVAWCAWLVWCSPATATRFAFT